MNTAERNERDRQDERLLEALANYGEEWVPASVFGRITGSARGAGRALSRLAREGRCELRMEADMNLYRPRQ